MKYGIIKKGAITRVCEAPEGLKGGAFMTGEIVNGKVMTNTNGYWKVSFSKKHEPFVKNYLYNYYQGNPSFHVGFYDETTELFIFK